MKLWSVAPAVGVVVATFILAGASAMANDTLPAPTARRIVVHGVDCSLDNARVCPEESLVFDELITMIQTAAQPLPIQLADHEDDAVSCGQTNLTVDTLRTCLVIGGLTAHASN